MGRVLQNTTETIVTGHERSQQQRSTKAGQSKIELANCSKGETYEGGGGFRRVTGRGETKWGGGGGVLGLTIVALARGVRMEIVVKEQIVSTSR